MTNAEFHLAIGRIRRLHWMHFPVQALVMLGVVLGASSQVGVGSGSQTHLASWPALVLLAALVPVVSMLLYIISRRLRPNIRRLAEENMRIYQSRIFLRNSLLSLLGLPLLASYFLTREVLELLACGALLLGMCLATVPTAKEYQRWLLR
ncbi:MULTISPECIES: hypothetical protein [Hymenobacter]|uniref:MFS transporter n=1 Tax=Hymenobacter mucosus TaxID=1411120 RepID=A0A238XVB6_9BACT|nr:MULTISPECIES: hypothetical protein [Hymenobacter]SNR62996.1 hypothetical protein SAMN06269173_104439 [Hymenobacter mucosus]